MDPRIGVGFDPTTGALPDRTDPHRVGRVDADADARAPRRHVRQRSSGRRSANGQSG